MYDVYNDWNNWITYSSDNTNFMIGQRNSPLQKIRNAKGDQKIFDVGCRAKKVSKELSVNVEENRKTI